jgi:hypothetical protein
MTKTKGVKYWKKKAWDEFSKYIRIRDALRTTNTVDKCVCCSCGKIYPAWGKGCLQAGHLVPGRGNGVLFVPLGCHGQCYNCNVRLKGNWPGYYDFMLKKYGQGAVDHLLDLSRKPVKLLPVELEAMRDSFKSAYESMKKNRELNAGETYEDYAKDITAFNPIGSHLWMLSR